MLIRQLREEAGVSTKRMCAEIGMTLGQLSDIERGIQTVSLRRAFQISQVLGVSFDAVVTEILRDKLADAGFRNATVSVTTQPPVAAVHVELATDEKPQV